MAVRLGSMNDRHNSIRRVSPTISSTIIAGISPHWRGATGATRRRESPANPNGIESSSPRLPTEGYLGAKSPMRINPERVESLRCATHPPSMAQSLARILLHTVFSTKERRPFLHDEPLREELHCYLGGILTNRDCQPLIIGGVEEHMHLLFALSRTATVADVVKELKRGSSVWLKTKSPTLEDFAWQNGYGVFSIGNSQVDAARAYIAGQAEHHRKISFQDELRELLRRYEIEFDERYVWD